MSEQFFADGLCLPSGASLEAGGPGAGRHRILLGAATHGPQAPVSI